MYLCATTPTTLFKANEVIQLGRKFTAAEAKEWGFVSEIYEPEELQTILLPKIQKMRQSLVPEVITDILRE